jgi:hypothetical protein
MHSKRVHGAFMAQQLFLLTNLVADISFLVIYHTAIQQ